MSDGMIAKKQTDVLVAEKKTRYKRKKANVGSGNQRYLAFWKSGNNFHYVVCIKLDIFGRSPIVRGISISSERISMTLMTVLLLGQHHTLNGIVFTFAFNLYGSTGAKSMR